MYSGLNLYPQSNTAADQNNNYRPLAHHFCRVSNVSGGASLCHTHENECYRLHMFVYFFIFDEKSYKSIVLVLMQMYSSWDLSRFVISVHRHDLHAALMRGNITL